MLETQFYASRWVGLQWVRVYGGLATCMGSLSFPMGVRYRLPCGAIAHFLEIRIGKIFLEKCSLKPMSGGRTRTRVNRAKARRCGRRAIKPSSPAGPLSSDRR